MAGICYYCEYSTWKGEKFTGCKYPRRYCPITGDYLGPNYHGPKDGTITEGALFDDVSLDTIQ